MNFGTETDVLIRLQESSDPELGDKVMASLRQHGEQVENRRIDYVGPQVGEELRDEGGIGTRRSLNDANEAEGR